MKKEFKISINIYPESIINKSISDFKDVSQIKYNNGVLEIFGENEEEIEEIFGEFSNYMIWLINEL